MRNGGNNTILLKHWSMLKLKQSLANCQWFQEYLNNQNCKIAWSWLVLVSLGCRKRQDCRPRCVHGSLMDRISKQGQPWPQIFSLHFACEVYQLVYQCKIAKPSLFILNHRKAQVAWCLNKALKVLVLECFGTTLKHTYSHSGLRQQEFFSGKSLSESGTMWVARWTLWLVWGPSMNYIWAMPSNSMRFDFCWQSCSLNRSRSAAKDVGWLEVGPTTSKRRKSWKPMEISFSSVTWLTCARTPRCFQQS